MRTRVIDHDPITNITSYWHDDGAGHYTTWEEQDTTQILEYNKSVRSKTKRRDRWGNGQYVAELPLSVLDQLRRDGILADQEAFLKWLSRNENEPFRTRYGQLA